MLQVWFPSDCLQFDVEYLGTLSVVGRNHIIKYECGEKETGRYKAGKPLGEFHTDVQGEQIIRPCKILPPRKPHGASPSTTATSAQKLPCSIGKPFMSVLGCAGILPIYSPMFDCGCLESVVIFNLDILSLVQTRVGRGREHRRKHWRMTIR